MIGFKTVVTVGIVGIVVVTVGIVVAGIARIVTIAIDGKAFGQTLVVECFVERYDILYYYAIWPFWRDNIVTPSPILRTRQCSERFVGIVTGQINKQSVLQIGMISTIQPWYGLNLLTFYSMILCIEGPLYNCCKSTCC
jgi:hypothetical protein